LLTSESRSSVRSTLVHLKIAPETPVHYDLTVPALYEAAIRNNEGELGPDGQLLVRTGAFTGRSPKDKFFVREPASETHIDWDANVGFDSERFDALLTRVGAYLSERNLYAIDAYSGADPHFRLRIRVVTQYAWHALFARTLFIPRAADDDAYIPEFTVVDAAEFEADPELDGTRAKNFVIIDFSRKLVVIGGTQYAGEIKKSVFTIMNYLMPLRGTLPMHCSANVGAAGDAALFFGLSGTGKTTLSADSARPLVGDDEHGWSTEGIFNFEGGCYAKVIRLSQKAEPEIWTAIHRFGAVLENVVIDERGNVLDLESEALTENTRAAYPLDHIPNIVIGSRAGHPRTIIMLTADAFGVLPPISRLTPGQAMYHFLSGYTAKVAGTELGVIEPTATFSTCFGAPFMVHHPTVYARLLGERIDEHAATSWLVNTGWSGGAFGVGKRMPIAHTRAMIAAALDGSLANVETTSEPFFGLAIPNAVPGVPDGILEPRTAWADGAAYDVAARDLAGRFARNFARFSTDASPEVKAAAIEP